MSIIKFTIDYKGQHSDWDEYFAKVYKRVEYPIDLEQMNWFYWSAPIGKTVNLYKTSSEAPLNGAYVGHYPQLGFFVKRKKIDNLFSTNGSLWMEIIRENRRNGMENHNWGHWFYEARGSGIWLNLGRTIDYSCRIDAKLQHIPSHMTSLYKHTCDTYGFITQYPNKWHPYLQLSGHRITPINTSQLFHTLVDHDSKFWIHRLKWKLDTVVRYWGLDLYVSQKASRREVSDLRTVETCKGPCTCVGTRKYQQNNMRTGLNAQWECECLEHQKFLNCK